MEVSVQLKAPASLPSKKESVAMKEKILDHCEWGVQPIKESIKGRSIAQAVSSWLSTAAARVRARVCSSGVYGGQSGAGAGFLRVL
jgi:hypothetical protein